MTSLERYERHYDDGRRLWVYGQQPGQLSPLTSADGADPVIGGHSHLRLDLLTDAWVAVVPGRNERPIDRGDQTHRDDSCPLCPEGTEVPFPYDAAVFENRFPALTAHAAVHTNGDPPVRPAQGRCEVVLYTPDHDAALGTLDGRSLLRVVAVWIDRSRALWSTPEHEHVLIFENRGAEVGATLVHPHGQAYAFPVVPPYVAARVAAAERRRSGGADWFAEAADRDVAAGREIDRNDAFSTAVPYAPRWPFEVRVTAVRSGLRRLTDLQPGEQLNLAAAISGVIRRYDRLFETPLPYMMAVQEAPRDVDDWRLHVDFLPPARSADRLKVRGAVETVTGFYVNDVLPEAAARQLAAVEFDPVELAGQQPWRVEVAAQSSVGAPARREVAG